MQIFLTFIPTCFYCFCLHCLTIKLNICYFDNGLFVLKSQESCQNIHKKRTVLTFRHNLLRTMASNCDYSTPNCVDKMEFLSALDSLKEQQKTSKSEITLFVGDNFYERAIRTTKSFLVTTKWFFPRVSFMKISCLHTIELHIEGDKRQNTG